MKFRGVMVISVVLVSLFPLGAADAARAPSLYVRQVQHTWARGTGQDLEASLNCPRGWRATGFGYGSGAMDMYYANVKSSGGGYEFLAASPGDGFGGYSPAPSGGWHFSATVLCAKGSGLAVKASLAQVGQTKSEAKREHEGLVASRN